MGSADLRRTSGLQKFAIFAGALILAYGLCLAAFSRTGFPRAIKTGSPFPYFADKPVGEDAYYMLSVARNISRGKGIVYNGGKRTTGIQPLATFLYAGLFWIAEKAGADEWDFVRLVLVFGVVLHVLLAHATGLVSRSLARGDPSARSRAYGLGFVFALLNFTLFRISAYGLETALYLVLVSLSVLATFGVADRPRIRWRRAALLGALFGVTALARIDFLVVAAVFLGIAVIRHKIDLARAALVGGITFLFVSPWLYWIKLTSGSWLPSSGQAQSILMPSKSLLARLIAMAEALGDHLTPWAFEAYRPSLIILGAASFAVAVFWLLRINREKSGLRLSASLGRFPFGFEWAMSLAVLVLVYASFFWARHFYGRYSAPVLVLYLPILANLFAERLERSRRLMEYGLMAGMVVVFAATSAMSLHTGAVGNTLAINPGFVRDTFPQSARIGAFQSGVLGFFQENVSNLDGKIDGVALRHLLAGTMARYLDEERIDVLIDWPSYIFPNIDREYLEEKWTPYPEKVPGDESVCFVRKSPR